MPVRVRQALLREIDEDEVLRWAGQPSARAFAWRAVGAAVAGALFAWTMGLASVVPAWMTWIEVGEISGNDSARRAASTVYVAIGLGAALALIGLLSLMWPWFAARRARRTVYAVTSTRVISLLVERAGTVRSSSVEPGHPLSISRRERSLGEGDVHLYPTAVQGRPGMLSLIAIRDAREVERVIRRTFDPPGAGSLG